MGRSALTVGINTYIYPKLGKLEAPARDAEAIAQQLESSLYSFQVERLPEVKDKANDGLKTGKKSGVTLQQLKEALVRYFKPRGTTYSDTVLFYFSGHGLYDDLMGKSYLATSDTNPEYGNWGYDLTYLPALLRNSPVKRQIIWLDCCHSGGLIAVNDANPGEQSGYSRCFVAASQEIELAYELTSGSYSVLTDALLQGLNPKRVPGQWINTLSLCDFVNQYLKNIRKTYPQRPLFLNVGEPIDLTYINAGSTSLEGLNELQVDVCPYRALNAFDFTAEDVKVFFGRIALTDELLAQIYEHNFLAVLGPSGSGKSSVVRAGLLYELQQGKRRSGTETWHILPIIRPGESPLRNLAGIFIPEILRTKKKGEALLSSSLSDLKARGADALVDLINEDYEQSVVLVVDQFEEIFTLCRGSQEKEQERKDFLDCLFGAVDTLAGKLRLVITLRADFLGKCLEQSYGNLAERIKNCRVDITPLTDSELDEVINKPAATVGLQVAPYLQDRLKEHIREAPGSLPLLEYALTELWRDWHTHYTSGDADVGNQLTFEGYDRIGGVAGALEKQANAVYESFAESTVKQGLVQRIFLELVQPGEETEDTRRQVLRQELISEIHPESMLDEVLGKLIEARLVVTDEIPTENDPNAVVIELAHEATIRHWQQLRYWLNKHRQDLPVIRQLRADVSTWQINNQKSKYLLVGARLDAALECVKKYQELGYISQNVHTFVQVSYETWIAEEKEKERQIFEAMCMTAEVQWKQQEQLESLLTITRAGKRLQYLLQTRPQVKPENSQQVLAQLQQMLHYRIQEKNRLEGYDYSLEDFSVAKVIAYSPDGKIIASPSSDDTIKLWNAMDGQFIASLEGHHFLIHAITYSPDGAILASASSDKTIRLWNGADGSFIKTLEGHSGSVTALAYSPDGAILASASSDKTIRLWNGADGSFIKTLEGHSDQINSVAYSPDGKILASASSDKTIRLWNVTDGSFISVEGHDAIVKAIVYSPDGATLASKAELNSDSPVKLWNAEDGSLRADLASRSDFIKAIAYSPDSKTLAFHVNGLVKLWNVESGSLIANLEYYGAEIDCPSHQINSIAYSPDSKTLAWASAFGADKTIKLCNTTDGSLITSLVGHSDSVVALAYSPDGKTLASSAMDNKLRLWNRLNGNLLMSLEGSSSEINAMDYSPDGKTFTSDSFASTFGLWKVVDDTISNGLKRHGAVRAITYSPDGKTIAFISYKKTPFSIIGSNKDSDETIKLWNTTDDSLITIRNSHDYSVHALAYSPDGRILASASFDKTIKFWNTTDGSLVLILKGHGDQVFAITYSPDGKTLASGSKDRTIKLWNTADGSLVNSLNSHDDTVRAVTYSPDGQMLASGSSDGTVKLWNMTDGSLIATLRGHKGVYAIAYSPDGKTLASSGNDSKGRTVKIWSVDFELNLDALMVQACGWLHDYLSHNPNVSASDKKLLERYS
ncbi:MAG: nSTAND1 domain-containing NTPase [Nostoc sp.]